MTVTQLGRELGITRQGASKLVASLRERGYIALESSAADGREKAVRPTQRARLIQTDWFRNRPTQDGGRPPPGSAAVPSPS